MVASPSRCFVSSSEHLNIVIIDACCSRSLQLPYPLLAAVHLPPIKLTLDMFEIIPNTGISGPFGEVRFAIVLRSMWVCFSCIHSTALIVALE